MKNIFITSLILVNLTIVACGPKKEKEKAATPKIDSLQITAKGLFQPLPTTAENPQNPITPEKVALGKILYMDTKLSFKGNNSCNTCHDLNTFGVDNKPTSAGDEGKNGDRNSPTVFNAALATSQFWDGRAKDVEDQADKPIFNPIEMHLANEIFLEKRLNENPAYPKMFATAFPNDKKPVRTENLKKAIGAFERTLMTPTKFDDYLKGNSQALSIEEKSGLNIFINTGCASCHNGAAMGGTMFAKFGLFQEYWKLTGSKHIDKGLATITKNDADMYQFRVPLLRNVEKTYPYFHDGSVAKLEDAVKIMGKSQLNKDLSEAEVTSIVVFLKTLTGNVPK